MNKSLFQNSRLAVQELVLKGLVVQAFMLIILLSGCGKSLHQKIMGKWAIDADNELFDMMGDEQAASEQKHKFVLEFSSAGIFRSTVDSSGYVQSKEGRWFFVEGEADVCKLKVSINSDNSNIDPDIVLTEVKFVDEETIELIPPNMDAIKQKIVFRRIR